MTETVSVISIFFNSLLQGRDEIIFKKVCEDLCRLINLLKWSNHADLGLAVLCSPVNCERKKKTEKEREENSKR